MGEGNNNREDLYSKVVRAGKRTYFFDVRTTRGNDLYITLTESKRKYDDNGDFRYEKHKLFLYKEDFDKFSEGLTEAISKVKELQETGEFSQESPMDRIGTESESDSDTDTESNDETSFEDVSFEDLGE